MNVFELFAKINVDSSGFESSVKKAGSVAKNALLGATGAIAVGTALMGKQFVSAAKNTAAYGDNVDKMSQKIGISAESYQKWDYVMQRAGTSIDSMKMGMKTLSKQAESNSDAFQKLGISQEQVASMSQEELFEATVRGLAGMEEGTERAALASELLGRAGADMGPLLNQGTEAIDEQMEMAEKYGMVMPDSAVKASAAFEDSVTTMKMTMQGLRNRMMGNFLPAITQVTDGLGKLFAGDMSGADDVAKGIENVITKMSDLMPKIIEVGGKVVRALADAILQNIPKLIPVVTQLFVDIAKYCIEALPQIIEIGIQIITTLINTIVEELPNLIEVFVQGIIQIATAIVEALPQLIEAIVGAIPMIIEALLAQMPLLIEAGIQLFTSLVQELPTIIANIVAVLPQIIDAIVATIPVLLPLIIDAGIQLFTALVEALPQIIETIVAVLPTIIESIINTLITLLPLIIDAGVQLFIALIENLPLIIDTIIGALPQIITAIVNTLAQNMPRIIEAGVKLFVALIKNLPVIIKEIVKAIPRIIAGIVVAVGEGVSSMAEAGKQLLHGLWEGIKGAGGWLWDKVSGFLGDIWDGILDFFGIASPSKEMAWVGEMISKGLAGGIEESAKQALDAASDLSEGLMNTLSGDYNLNPSVALNGDASGSLYGGGLGGVTMNIYASDGMDVNELAERVEQRLVQLERQRANAWA